MKYKRTKLRDSKILKAYVVLHFEKGQWIIYKMTDSQEEAYSLVNEDGTWSILTGEW